MTSVLPATEAIDRLVANDGNARSRHARDVPFCEGGPDRRRSTEHEGQRNSLPSPLPVILPVTRRPIRRPTRPRFTACTSPRIRATWYSVLLVPAIPLRRLRRAISSSPSLPASLPARCCQKA